MIFQMRVHVDSKICEAAGSAMMEWNGTGTGGNDETKNDQIDRFDVRAHLDIIPAKKKKDQDFDNCFDKSEISEGTGFFNNNLQTKNLENLYKYTFLIPPFCDV